MRLVQPGDAGEIYTLQRACWLAELEANPGVEIPALKETLEDVRRWIAEDTVFVLRSGGRLVGAVRASLHGSSWHLGRLMVAPDLSGRGLGRMLLETIESAAPDEVGTYELFTGARSERNLKMYKKAGYRRGDGDAPPGAVHLSKRRR
ncbi:MAG: GNAT family N-acetyltransferase [Nocardioides sp.]|nr:GNAT family N-acetyltransferase [Nocardioides sp.]